MCTIRICTKDGRIFEIVALCDDIPNLWPMLKEVEYKVFHSGAQALPSDFGFGFIPNWVERFEHE